MDSTKRRVRVGSRKSQLALVQTNHVVDALKSIHQDLEIEIVTMMTTGDHILDKPLSKIGEKSVFTKELEKALMDKVVDLVVHSLKDLPTSLPDGVVIGAILQREDPSDAVLFRKDLEHLRTLQDLPEGSVVGTSSLRRIAQLRRAYPHLLFSNIRGNLNTRLRKLDESGGAFSALILASAGVIRMGWQERISHRLPRDICMYAVGQGAIAVESRFDDKFFLDLVSKLNHDPTVRCCVAERAFLRTLGGGCSVPVAVHSEILNNNVVLTGGVFSLDGSHCLIAKHSNNPTSDEEQASVGPYVGIRSHSVICGVQSSSALSLKALWLAEATGDRLAKMLLQRGALAILTEARRQNESQ